MINEQLGFGRRYWRQHNPSAEARLVQRACYCVLVEEPGDRPTLIQRR
jgi:hypothetical protein